MIASTIALGTERLAENDHVRRVLRTGLVERLRGSASAELVIDSLLVGQAARDVLVAAVTFKKVPLGVIVLATALDQRCPVWARSSRAPSGRKTRRES